MTDHRATITDNTYLIPPKRQGAYTIKECDLSRLETMIGQITPHPKLYHNLAMALLGIAASTLVTLLTLLTVKDVASFVWISIGAILLLSSMLTVVFWVIDKRQQEETETSVEHVLEEIQRLKRNFDKPPVQISKPLPVIKQLPSRTKELPRDIRSQLAVLRSFSDEDIVAIVDDVNAGERTSAMHRLEAAAKSPLINPKYVIDKLSDCLKRIG